MRGLLGVDVCVHGGDDDGGRGQRSHERREHDGRQRRHGDVKQGSELSAGGCGFNLIGDDAHQDAETGGDAA